MKFLNYIGILVVGGLIAACSGPRTVTINSVRPAEIGVPNSIKTLLILDRTKSNNQAVNVIEGIFSGELPGEDKMGAQELLTSLSNQLSYTNRYVTLVAEERMEGNGITSVFPEKLSWEIINKLTAKYQADALLSLELFDSDFIVTKGKRNSSSSAGDQNSQGLTYYAQGVGNITIGIRLYDPTAQRLIDQQLLTNSHSWETSGGSLGEAVAQLTSKGDATRYLSNQAGADYAYKIAPMPVRIKRSFRGKSKKSPELELGTRYADVGQWERAMEAWKNGLDRAREKEAGYLAHNIAIAYEVLGDFDNALNWAETAYTQYGNEDSRSYVSKIKQRLASEELAKKQLGLTKSPDY
jgi:tetratricopeptide (TPR) repeat protein